jgi:hypothetical protein
VHPGTVIKQSSTRLALLAAAALLGACGEQAVYTSESFASDTPFKLKVEGEPATACEGARRSLLGNGYLIENADEEQVKARKARKNADKLNTFIEINVVCARDNVGSTMFANGVVSTYDLKKSSSAASVGVSAVGSISLPIGQSADSLVKIGEETIDDAEFYRRFFAAVQHTLAEMQVRSTPEEPPATATAPLAPATPAQTVEAMPTAVAAPAIAAQPAPQPTAALPAAQPAAPTAQPASVAPAAAAQPASAATSSAPQSPAAVVQAAPEPAAQPITVEQVQGATTVPTASLPSDLPPELMPPAATTTQQPAGTPNTSGLVDEAFPSAEATSPVPAPETATSKPAPPVLTSVEGTAATTPAASPSTVTAPAQAPATAAPVVGPVVLPEPEADPQP